MSAEHSTAAVYCILSHIAVHDLVAIEAESNRPPWTFAMFAREFVQEYTRVFGVRLDGYLAGYALCHVVDEEAHLAKLGIRAEQRGMGLGKGLLSHLLHELHREGVRWVTLEVRRSNMRARSLYESFGFFELGVRERYYTDDGEDALVLRLDLSQGFVVEQPIRLVSNT